MAENNDILGIVGHLDISDIYNSLEKMHSAISQITGVSQEMAKKMEDAYKAVGNATEKELAQKSKEALDIFSQVLTEIKDLADKNVSSIEQSIENLQKQLIKASNEIENVPLETKHYNELKDTIEGLNQQINIEEQNLSRAKDEAEALSVALEKVSNAKVGSESEGGTVLPETPPVNDNLQQSKEAAEILIEKLKEVADQSAQVNEQLQDFGKTDTDTTNIDELKAKLEEYATLTQQTAGVASAAYRQQEEYVNKLRDAQSELNEKIKNFEGNEDELQHMNEQYAQMDEELAKGEQNLGVLNDAMKRSAEEAEEARAALERCNAAIQQIEEQSEQSEEKVDSLWQKLKGWATGHGKLSEGLDTFKKGLDKLPIPLKTATDGIGDMVKGMWQMCKTPIGIVLAAITLALQSLFQWFTKNAEGQKQFARVSAYVGSILSSLSDIAVKVGKYLFNAFATSNGAMNGFAKGLVTTFKAAVETAIKLITGLGKGVKGLYQILTGDFKEGWETLKDAGSDMATAIGSAINTITNSISTAWKGITGVVKMAKDGINELNNTDLKGQLNEMISKAKESGDLAFKQKETEIAISKAKEKEAALDAEIAKSREKIYTLQGKERLEEIQRLKAMQQEKYGERIKQYEEMYKIQKRTNELHSSTLADEEKERQLNIQLLQLKAQQAAATRMTARLEESTKRTIANEGKRGGKQTAAVSAASAKRDELIYTNEEARIRLEKDLEAKIADARVKAMKDGFDKTEEERKRQNEAELDNIEKQRQAAIDAEYKRQKAQHEAEQAVIKAQGGKVVNWNKDMFDSNSSDVRAINRQFDKIVEFTKQKQLNVEEEIEDQQLQLMRDYLKEYGTFQQQKLAIAEEYAKKIAEAEAKGDKGEVLKLEKQKQQAESNVEYRAIEAKIDWYSVFDNMGLVMKGALEEQLNMLRNYIKSPQYQQLQPDQKQTITNAMSNIRQAIGSVDGLNFHDLARAVKEYQTALQEQKTAEEAYKQAELIYGKELEAAKKRLKAADPNDKEEYKAATNAVESLQNKLNTVGETLNEANKKVKVSGQNLAITTKDVTQPVSEITAFLKASSIPQLGELFAAFDQLKGGLEGLKALKNLKGNEIAEAGEEIGEKLSDAAQKGAKGIEGAGQTLATTLGKGGLIAQIISAILSILDILKDGIGTLVSNLIDTILNAIDGIINNILSGKFIEQIVGSIIKGVGNIIDTVIGAIGSVLSFGKLSSGGPSDWFTNSNAKEVEDTINRLTDRNERLQQSIVSLRKAVDANTGARAIEYSNQAKEYQQEYNKNILGKFAAEMSYHNAHHSNAYYYHLSDEIVNEINAVLEKIGSDNRVRNDYWEDLLNLTPEEMDAIRSQAMRAWDVITDQGYYDKAYEYLNEYADMAGKIEEINDELAESLTNTTEENVFDDFLESLYKLADGSEDVFKDIANNWQEMVNKMAVKNLVASSFQAKLNDWYKKLAQLNQDVSTGKITEKQYRATLEELKKKYDGYVKDAETDIKRLREMNIIKPTGNSPDQQATYNSLEKWTYDQADELISRATAMQIIQEHQFETLQGTLQVANMIMTDVGSMKVSVGEISQSIATTIDLHTSANDKLDKIVTNTAPISEIRDFVKKLYNER